MFLLKKTMIIAIALLCSPLGFSESQSDIEKNLKKIASSDFFGFRFAILERDGQRVYILGESHFKNWNEKSRGSKLVAHFPIIGFEHVPDEERELLLSALNDSELFQYHLRSAVRDLPLVEWTIGVFSSTIYDALKQTSQNIDATPGRHYREQIALTLASFDARSDRLAIGLEGSYRLPAQNKDAYLLTARNARMARNIDFIVKNLPRDLKPGLLAIVGYDHLPGILQELDKRGFGLVLSSNDVLKESNPLVNGVMYFTSLWTASYMQRRWFLGQGSIRSFVLAFLFYRINSEFLDSLYYSFPS